MAPEVLKKNYDQKCDIWSCGVILFILLSGGLPFKGKTKQAILDQIMAGTYSLEGKEWTEISLEAKSFVKRLLTYEPAERYSAEEALNDPWLHEMVKEENDRPLMTSALNNLRTFRVALYLLQAKC